MLNSKFAYKATSADGSKIDTWVKYTALRPHLPTPIRSLMDSLVDDPQIDNQTIHIDLSINNTRHQVSFFSN